MFRKNRRKIAPTASATTHTDGDGLEKVVDPNLLTASGQKGMMDFMYISIFFVFSSLAASGVLLYFLQSADSPEVLSFGVRDHCGGYGDKWALQEGGLVLCANADYGVCTATTTTTDTTTTDTMPTDDDEEMEREGSQSKQSAMDGFYNQCYSEYVVKSLSNNFGSLVEIYLLSLLLFLSLVLEMKSYMSVEAERWFNITTVGYYVTECVIFFYYVASFIGNMGSDRIWSNPKMTAQLEMMGPTNSFIWMVMAARFCVVSGITFLVYKFKTQNTTEYVPKEDRKKSCNESCSYVVLVGLSSFLAVFALIAYLEDPSEPGQFVLSGQCGDKVLETYIDQCGRHDLNDDERPCISGDLCLKCGYIGDNAKHYPFFTEEEKDCISTMLTNPMVDKVNSFVLAYCASYLFFLVLLHGERNRYQTTKSWYAFRICFMLMLFIEMIVFNVFRSHYSSVTSTSAEEVGTAATLTSPRPMEGTIGMMIIGVALARFLILFVLFSIEQYEVGGTYCIFCKCLCKNKEAEAEEIDTKTIDTDRVVELTAGNGDPIPLSDI